VKILIVDDHAVIRAGTRLLLRETGNDYVCDEASGCCEALLKVQANEYDVMLLGLSLPDLCGFETLDRFKSKHPNLPVIVVSIHTDKQLAVKAYALEADGYIDVVNKPEDLVLAIEKVAQGGKFICEHLVEGVLAGLHNRKSAGQASTTIRQLSKREEQIAELLVSGATNKEIAWRLSLSIKTVSTFKMRILGKLHLKNLVELVKYRSSPSCSEIPAESRAAPSRHRSG
jgi:two-component system invasion response regulator UvrY